MTFKILTGIKINNPPEIKVIIPNYETYYNQLLDYKMNLDSYFTDKDGDKLFYVVTKIDGGILPDWLSYEDVTQTLSGISRENDTNVLISVTADDRKGGSITQIFTLVVTEYTGDRSYIPLIIVSSLIAAFVIVVVGIMCLRNVKWRRCFKKKTDKNDMSDDSSLDEDDDICIEDVKPKNPF